LCFYFLLAVICCCWLHVVLCLLTCVWQASMENVKVWNKKYADRGMRFGETSRSDMLEEEKVSLGERIPTSAFNHNKRGYNTNSYPQPRLAVQLGHTANNVRTSLFLQSHHFFFKLLKFHGMCLLVAGSYGIQLVQCFRSETSCKEPR